MKEDGKTGLGGIQSSRMACTNRTLMVCFWLCTNLNPVRGIPASVGVCLIGVSSTNLYSTY